MGNLANGHDPNRRNYQLITFTVPLQDIRDPKKLLQAIRKSSGKVFTALEVSQEGANQPPGLNLRDGKLFLNCPLKKTEISGVQLLILPKVKSKKNDRRIISIPLDSFIQENSLSCSIALADGNRLSPGFHYVLLIKRKQLSFPYNPNTSDLRTVYALPPTTLEMVTPSPISEGQAPFNLVPDNNPIDHTQWTVPWAQVPNLSPSNQNLIDRSLDLRADPVQFSGNRHGRVIVEIFPGCSRGWKDVPEHQRGRLSALMNRKTIDYLKAVGATDIFLMPITQTATDRGHKKNVWGYMPLGLLSLDPRYFVSRDYNHRIDELRAFLRYFQSHKIRVGVDLVAGHSADGQLPIPDRNKLAQHIASLANHEYQNLLEILNARHLRDKERSMLVNALRHEQPVSDQRPGQPGSPHFLYTVWGSDLYHRTVPLDVGQNQHQYLYDQTGCGNTLDPAKPSMARLIKTVMAFYRNLGFDFIRYDQGGLYLRNMELCDFDKQLFDGLSIYEGNHGRGNRTKTGKAIPLIFGENGHSSIPIWDRYADLQFLYGENTDWSFGELLKWLPPLKKSSGVRETFVRMLSNHDGLTPYDMTHGRDYRHAATRAFIASVYLTPGPITMHFADPMLRSQRGINGDPLHNPWNMEQPNLCISPSVIGTDPPPTFLFTKRLALIRSHFKQVLCSPLSTNNFSYYFKFHDKHYSLIPKEQLKDLSKKNNWQNPPDTDFIGAMYTNPNNNEKLLVLRKGSNESDIKLPQIVGYTGWKLLIDSHNLNQGTFFDQGAIYRMNPGVACFRAQKS